MIIAGSYEYNVEMDYREAFKQEDFNNRFSDILSKYDYIVGDWGYGQLRLKGFYDDQNTKATFDTKIGTLQDYLYEYCNFGAAYFILKRGMKQIEQPVEKVAKVEEITEATEVTVDAKEVEVVETAVPTEEVQSTEAIEQQKEAVETVEETKAIEETIIEEVNVVEEAVK